MSSNDISKSVLFTRERDNPTPAAGGFISDCCKPRNQMLLEYSSDIEQESCPLKEALKTIKWDSETESDSDELNLRSEGCRTDSSLNSESLEELEHSIELWKLATKHHSIVTRANTATEEIRLKGLFNKKKKLDEMLLIDNNNNKRNSTSRQSKETRSSKKRNETGDKSKLKDDTVMTAVRVRLPQIAVTLADKKSDKRNRRRENPYIGSTPRTPVEIVQPNADGIYDFTPSAAAFKWNWNVLDVSRRPLGGMTPYTAATPFNAFGKFREDFHATPAQKNNTLLVRQPSRRKRFDDPSASSFDDLPEFPDERKVAKAIRKRNLAFTPGGRKKGREVELSYRPLYDALVTEGAAEQTAYRIKNGTIVSTQKNRDPAIRARGRSQIFDSSNSASTVVNAEDGSHEEKKRLIRTSSSTNNYWSAYRNGKTLGSSYYNYHIVVHIGNAMINFINLSLLEGAKPEVKTVTGSVRRLKAVVDTPMAFHWIIILSVIVPISGFLYEGIRVMLITTKTPQNKENISFCQALKKAIISSANALAILAGFSFGISVLNSTLFTLLQSHPSSPDFIKNETKAFMWSVALIHSGVASGLLTSKALSSGCSQSAKPALEQLRLHKIGVIIGSLAPASLGWIGLRLLVNLIRPTTIDPLSWKYENNWWLPQLMGLIEYFESLGYWKILFMWSVASICTLILLDFVDLTVSLTGQFYRYGYDQKHIGGTKRRKGVIGTLARTALATVIGTGSFWQWPVSIATQIGNRIKLTTNPEFNYAQRNYV